MAEADVRASYVEWSAIFAGAVAASAISFVLFTVGGAIGLSLLSPYPSQSYGRWAATISAFWAIFVPILSLLIGGYIAGRMRAAWSADVDEVRFRDGIHGMLVWSISVLTAGLLTFMAAGTAIQAGGEFGKAAIGDRGTLVASSVDALLRHAPAGAGPATGETASQVNRDELTRILVSATADGSLDSADRDYIAQAIARRTGLAPDAVQKRIDEAFSKAVAAVDTARKATVAAGLATATALLLGLAAAWYAAQRGGHHRDQNIPARLTYFIMRKRV